MLNIHLLIFLGASPAVLLLKLQAPQGFSHEEKICGGAQAPMTLDQARICGVGK